MVKKYFVDISQQSGLDGEVVVKHFQARYVCKKCFVLVQKCIKLEEE